MKTIEKGLVDETWREVSLYSEDRMMGELRRFFSAQPQVAPFIIAFTEDYHERVRSLAFYLAYVVFRMLEKGGGEITMLPREALEDAFENNENWLQSIQDMDERLLARRIKHSTDFRQSFVIQYVMDALYRVSEEDYHKFLDDGSRAVLLIILKTFIDALDGLIEG